MKQVKLLGKTKFTRDASRTINPHRKIVLYMNPGRTGWRWGEKRCPIAAIEAGTKRRGCLRQRGKRRNEEVRGSDLNARAGVYTSGGAKTTVKGTEGRSFSSRRREGRVGK